MCSNPGMSTKYSDSLKNKPGHKSAKYVKKNKTSSNNVNFANIYATLKTPSGTSVRVTDRDKLTFTDPDIDFNLFE